MKYSFDIPRPRGLSSGLSAQAVQQNEKAIRDLILHVLIARLAFNDESNLEFETVYNSTNQIVDLLASQEDLDVLNSVSIGPKLRQYIDWLTGAVKTESISGATEIVRRSGVTNILVDTSSGNIPVYLPSPTNDAIINIKKIAGNGAIIVYPNGSEKIDGQDSLRIEILYASYQFCSDGTNWFIL